MDATIREKQGIAVQWRSINQRGSTMLEIIMVLTVCITLMVMANDVSYHLYKSKVEAKKSCGKNSTKKLNSKEEVISINNILYRKQIPGRPDSNTMNTNLTFFQTNITSEEQCFKTTIDHKHWKLAAVDTEILVTVNGQSSRQDDTIHIPEITLNPTKEDHCQITPNGISLQAPTPLAPNQRTMQAPGVTVPLDVKHKLFTRDRRIITSKKQNESLRLHSGWSALPMFYATKLSGKKKIQDLADKQCGTKTPSEDNSLDITSMGRLFIIQTPEHINKIFICGKKKTDSRSGFIHHAYEWQEKVSTSDVEKLTKTITKSINQKKYTPLIENDIAGVTLPTELNKDNCEDVYYFLKEVITRCLVFIIHYSELHHQSVAKTPNKSIKDGFISLLKLHKDASKKNTTTALMEDYNFKNDEVSTIEQEYKFLHDYISKTSIDMDSGYSIDHHKAIIKTLNSIIRGKETGIRDNKEILLQYFIEKYNNTERLPGFIAILNDFESLKKSQTAQSAQSAVHLLRDIVTIIAQKEKFRSSKHIQLRYTPNIAIGLELTQHIEPKDAEYMFNILCNLRILESDNSFYTYNTLVNTIATSRFLISDSSSKLIIAKFAHKVKNFFIGPKEKPKIYSVHNDKFATWYNKKCKQDTSELSKIIRRAKNLCHPLDHGWSKYLKKDTSLPIRLLRSNKEGYEIPAEAANNPDEAVEDANADEDGDGDGDGDE